MPWCECVCGHHRSNHPWEPHRHGACRHCLKCDKPSDEHYLISHHFDRCPCNLYEETP